MFAARTLNQIICSSRLTYIRRDKDIAVQMVHLSFLEFFKFFFVIRVSLVGWPKYQLQHMLANDCLKPL